MIQVVHLADRAILVPAPLDDQAPRSQGMSFSTSERMFVSVALVLTICFAQVDNYYILSIRPAKTVRWIIIWSYTAIRLPDVRPLPLLYCTARVLTELTGLC